MTDYGVSDYDRRLKACMREYEAKIRSLCTEKLDRLVASAPAGDEIPVIGGTLPPMERRGELAEDIMRAMCARVWFTFEAPQWAQPLPLTPDEIIACFNGVNDGKLRSHCVGNYARSLREFRWHVERIQPFEIYCAMELAPP